MVGTPFKVVSLFYCPGNGCQRNVVVTGNGCWIDPGEIPVKDCVLLFETLMCCWSCSRVNRADSAVQSWSMDGFERDETVLRLRESVMALFEGVNAEMVYCIRRVGNPGGLTTLQCEGGAGCFGCSACSVVKVPIVDPLAVVLGLCSYRYT